MKPPILASPVLAALPGVRHAFFTRKGGVSSGLYASLNAGRGSRDAAADVAENRRRAAGVFDARAGALNTCHQTHSARAVVAVRSWGDERPLGDAVVTRARGVICCALAADCAPVLIADAKAGVVAAIHAGWKGALAGIVEAAVGEMKRLGADPSRMVAAIGPCIAKASYEVGVEFQERFQSCGAGAERFFGPGASADKRQFDLPGFVGWRLEAAGVAAWAPLGRDTCAEEEDFFSNRRAALRGEDDYGRLLSAIMLEQ
jgi:YfiH family protein